MLHDVQPWPIWSDIGPWNRLYDAADAFGIAEAEFRPYWQDSGAQTDEQVLVSAYTRNGKAMLAIMNIGEAIEAKVRLDLAKLGLSKAGKAVDVLREETLPVEGATLNVPMARRQGRVVEVTATE